jgi:hypothetical protein
MQTCASMTGRLSGCKPLHLSLRSLLHTRLFAGLLAGASGLLTGINHADEPLRFEPAGIVNGELQVNVTGQGARVIVDASTNLVDWTPALTNNLVNGAAAFVDPDVGQRPLRYYRGRMILLSELTPTEVTLFAGDTILFHVNEGPPGTAWVFKVNGVVNGNAGFGTMLLNPGDPASAAYRAPTGISGPVTFTVCAEDLNDPARIFCGTVTVHPLPGTLVIVPPAATLRLDGTQQFQAGANVTGVGFVPLNHVVWKLNGNVGTDPNRELGMIDLDGLFTAPPKMPDGLPRAIQVGFSTTLESPVLTSAPVTLAEVTVTPPQIVSVQAGPAGAVTATLRRSDNTTTVLGAGQVAFASGFEAAAVDGGGNVTIGHATGVASIFATHLVTGATGSMVVESRPDVHLRLLSVRQRSPHVLNINPTASGFVFRTPTTPVSEIEVTQPGVMLNLAPDIFFFRGTTNFNTNSFAGAGHRAVSFTGDANLVRHFEIGSGVVHTAGLVARLERRTGFVEFGDTPGAGVVTMTYDDGVITRTATTTLRYTRLNLAAELRGATTQQTGTAFVSEWLSLKINVSNPRTENSRFMGDTLVRVRQQGESFLVVRIPEKYGFTQLPVHKEYVETTEYVHQLPSGPSNRNPSQFAPVLGEIQLWIMAQRGGEHRFLVDLPSDPGVPPVELVIDLQLPELQLRPLAGVTNGSSIVLNSYFDARFVSNNLSLFATPEHPDTPNFSGPYHPREEVAWFVKRPGGQTNVLTANVTQFQGLDPFPTTLRETGAHEVWLGYRNRPGIRSTAVPVNVVVPAGPLFSELELLPLKPQTNQLGQPVPRENQYAGLHVVAPTITGYTEDVPVNVTLRLFTADGVAKRLGKKIVSRFRTSNNPDNPTFTTNYVLGGVVVTGQSDGRSFQVQNPDAIGSLQPVDENGFVNFDIVVRPSTSSTARQTPVRPQVRPVLQSLSPFTLPNPPPDLPVEFFDYLDNVLVASTTVPLAVAQFENEPDHSYRWQVVSLGDHGVNAVPKAIPVASQRVRDAVAVGKLPGGAQHATFTLFGDDDFGAALAAGEPVLALGDGLQLVSQTINGNALAVTLATDLNYFEAGEFSSRYGNRTLALNFPNGAQWVTEISLFGYRIEPQEFMLDRNVPLNAAYGHWETGFSPGKLIPFRDEEGSVLFEVRGRDFRQIWGVDLELIPSLHACWDANLNGLEDAGEDLDGDGFFTEQDVNMPVIFRGARPENPLVGFRRDVDPRNGAPRVRQLVSRMAPSYGGQFRIFGDLTDHRRLNWESKTLGGKFDPDLIPDFVSPVADGEVLLARHGPNLFDVQFFSVYNFMTEVREDLPDPELEFAVVGASRDAAYEAYSGFSGTLKIGSPEAGARAARGLSVSVDRDATPRDFRPEDEGDFDSKAQFLKNFYPHAFYGGVLDQKWQRRVININSAGVPATPLFTDDRMRPYVSRYHGPTPTGAQRIFFGADLDGVLYDPTSINFPKPRYYDFTGGLLTAAEFLAAQRIDENPNSTVLRNIPVVGAAVGDTTLTGANLLRRIGATSGGFADLTRHRPGRLGAEAKTPGADVPGLHAGFLIFGQPEQVRDPRNSLIEDDIRDVLIKRDDAGNLVRENRFLGTPASRFVHGFAANEDRKRFIRTAAQANLRFAVVTDPPNVVPDDPATWKIRPNILVREQLSADNTPDLVVASQSEGNEHIIKLVADEAVDWAADLTAAAVLSVLTGGSYLEACALPQLGKKALGSFRNLAVGIVDAEFIEPYFEKNQRDAIHFINRNFTTTTFTNLPIPGVNWGESAKLIRDTQLYTNLVVGLTNALYGLSSNVLHQFGITNRGLYFHLPPEVRLPDFLSPPTSFCDLLTKPVEVLKNEIKATYSAETFGGLGSAEAVGTKVLAVAIPAEAQISPGVFQFTYSVTRKIDVQPKQPTEVTLESLPWQSVFASYPFADEMSDEQFLRTLLAKRFDPVAGDHATQIWRAVQRKSVRRDVSGARYQSYKLRAWQMPELSATIAPFQQTGTGQPVGDFALTPNETEIPVAVAVGAIVTRANENATARALVTTPGYEVILRQGTLMQPPGGP